ncbi:peptidoglycan-binding protein LysM [Maritimibacter sp. 55A14]|uniref:LysM peptidoglycan-binding domain-containing protein n=1 Tax=Maritimibacter sp. 55A14 TaxID=2174844 RepID=UPI000D611F11|nr:transporter substrate-binding domain-containing protein [Maritimibacter sp. 55A14]PWE31389.1 peptidoglycan-binding protein LysM [Maritimibacter sp. 55A14]
MRHSTGFIGVSALALIIGAGSAWAQEDCGTYQVAPGDSLQKIASSVYGDVSFRVIYDANRDEIGYNPNVIEAGMVLRLPCIDRPLPEKTVQRVPEAAEAPAAAEDKTIVLITGNDFPPFTDESLPGRGMFTELVETAALRAESGQTVEVRFVNDWDAHFETLLPVQAFDGSFPWTRPDCEAPASLSDEDRNRCENYIFSDPFYEVVDGLFARKGSPFTSTLDVSDLAGTRICRPEGYSTARLDTVGLSEPIITLYRPVRVADCFDALMGGTVDIVAIDSLVGTDMIEFMGLTNEIVENQNLGKVSALHVLVHKDNSRGKETLDLLNAGLREMVGSGEWYDIVSSALRRGMMREMN